jgi:type I site-specific restriction-modification system R (restriction) subunit
MQNPTLVVLTDRNDLDDQLFGQFQRCADILGQTPVQAASREQAARAAGRGERRRGLHHDPEVHAREGREDARA